MASASIFYTTQRNAIGQVTTANTGRDGSGAVVTIMLAGTSGSKIERIIIQAIGTTTAGFVRLYLHDGATAYLWKEITVSAITPSATVAAFHDEVDCSLPGSILIMPTLYSLKASTHNTETFNVIAIGANA